MAEKRRSLFGPAAAAGAGGPVVVLGLGRFGRGLALELTESGAEVLGIDGDPAVVQSLNGRLTHVVRADVTDEVALRQLGVHEADTVVVSVGSDLAASILTTSLMIRFGTKHLWAKADDVRHEEILRQLGVRHVVHPERDMGRRVAHLVRDTLEDFIEVEPGFAILRAGVSSAHVGKDLRGAGLAAERGLRVLAVKDGEGWMYPPPYYKLRAEDQILVAGPPDEVELFVTID